MLHGAWCLAQDYDTNITARFYIHMMDNQHMLSSLEVTLSEYKTEDNQFIHPAHTQDVVTVSDCADLCCDVTVGY
jgi:hypothetical protein